MKQIENRNKTTSYSENNITISIDQDPINQLVLIASNRLQYSNPVCQFISLHNLTYMLQAELQDPVKSYLQSRVFSSVTITMLQQLH